MEYAFYVEVSNFDGTRTRVPFAWQQVAEDFASRMNAGYPDREPAKVVKGR
jgi:hypothetical protein